jgi:hypothetical protein
MKPFAEPTNRGCYCLCSVAHPKAADVCQPNNAVTERDVKGRPVQMCAACAAEHDKRHAAAAPKPPERRDLDGRLTELAERAMPPGVERDQALSALAFIREAWSGGDNYADPRQALEVIADNANDLLALLKAVTAASEVA